MALYNGGGFLETENLHHECNDYLQPQSPFPTTTPPESKFDIPHGDADSIFLQVSPQMLNQIFLPRPLKGNLMAMQTTLQALQLSCCMSNILI